MEEERKAVAKALIPQFKFQQVLNQDQNGRRISLLGEIASQPALITLERAAFPTDPSIVTAFLGSLSNIQNLQHNDIYRWYLSNRTIPLSTEGTPADLKLNLIYPCTAQHIAKYSTQRVHLVTETPDIYSSHVRPHMSRCRDEGRLNWVFNILEGRTEQEDVILRESGATEGFLLLPDLNWDRKTLTGLHLLALVERRDLWSLRDMKRRDVSWLKRMRERVLEAVVGIYHGEIEKDELKCYVHYQPTYYHFHIHVVHVMLEAGATQAVGKAFGLENLISQLEGMAGGDEVGMESVSLTYTLGEKSELWKGVFGPLKEGGARTASRKIETG